jgi:transposase
VRDARVVLLSADGVKGKEIAKRVGITPEYVSRIRKCFDRNGVDGLAERERAGRKDHAVAAAETIGERPAERRKCANDTPPRRESG